MEKHYPSPVEIPKKSKPKSSWTMEDSSFSDPKSSDSSEEIDSDGIYYRNKMSLAKKNFSVCKMKSLLFFRNAMGKFHVHDEESL